MALTKGDVVLVPFSFTNLQQTKLRPAVVLWADANGQDVTLCFVSSQDIDNLNLIDTLFCVKKTVDKIDRCGVEVFNAYGCSTKSSISY